MTTEKAIIQSLKERGMRLTRARLGLIALLAEAQAPLSVPELLAGLEKRGTAADKTTVYREMERLGTLGFVVPVDLGDRRRYYELASEHHHHLVCLRCDRIEDIALGEEALRSEEKRAGRENGFRILRHSLEFFGLCRACA